jgi:hypothetical protein
MLLLSLTELERNHTSVQLEVEDTHLVEPCEVAIAFAKHFHSV